MPNQRTLRPIAAYGLLICAGAVLVVLGIFIFDAAPASIQVSESGAQIFFQADRNQVFFPGECVHVRWQVEGIREVYFNGEGVIGSGERIACPAAGSPVLTIRTMDDATLSYELPVRITTLNLLTYALLGLLILTLGIVIRLGEIPVVNRIARTGHVFWLALRSGVASTYRYAIILLQHPLVVVTTLTLFGAALRFHDAAHRSLVQDEAVLHLIASGDIGQVVDQNARWNSSPPLYPLMINAVLLIGNSELLLRAISAFASIAAIPMMYVLSRQFFSRAASYLCALVVTVALTQVYFAQYVREYSLTVLLAAMIIFVYWRYRRAPTRKNLLILATCWVIGILMQYGLPFLILALNLMLLYEFLVKKRWRDFIAPIAVLQAALLLAVVFVYLVSLRQHIPRFGSESYVASGYWNQAPNSLVPMLIDNTIALFRFAFGSGIFGQQWESNWFLIVAAFGVLVVLLDSALKPRTRVLFLLPFCLAIAAALFQLYPYSGSRQSIYLTVIVYLFFAAAFDFLLNLSNQRVIRVLAAVLCAGVVMTSLDNVLRYYGAPGFDDVQPAVRYIEANLQSSDRILVVSYADSMFNYYYTRHHPDEMGSRLFYTGNLPTEYGSVIDNLRQHPGRIWVVLAKDSDVFMNFVSQQPYGTQTTNPLSWTNVELYLIDG